MSSALLLLCGGLLPAALVTAWARAYTHRAQMLDIPNHRSSHAVPVPRGGGMAIVGTVLAGTLLLGATGTVTPQLLAAIVPGGLAVALVGWIDDKSHVRASVRAAVHILAALWAVVLLGGLPVLHLGDTQLVLGGFGSVLAVAGIVWFLNLFNFMDGIDGLAASQAVLICLVGGGLAYSAGNHNGGAVYMLLAGAAGGFLLWNWPPARIFMGDVGSGFLGYALAVLSVAGERSGSVPMTAWIILVGVFGFDATVTLVRRLLRRERLYEPHRRHAYQRAVISGLSHQTVTLAAAALTALLGASAILVATRPSLTAAVTLAAVAMVGVCYMAVERREPMYRDESA
jgi:Fuc2NAc and GlcNAc transferase